MLPLIALFTACSGDGSGPAEIEHVMRDCEPAPGRICPWAGDGYNGWNGDDVHRLDAWFSFPMSVTFSERGPPILADWNNHKLRRVLDDPADGYQTIMGTDFLGDGDAEQLDLTEAGAAGTDVNLNHPTQQIYFEDGTLLSASWHTHKLRTWDPETGKVRVYLGGPPGFHEDFEEPADDTLLDQPKEVIFHPGDENLVYILDMRNERIRVLDRDRWVVNTVAGTGEKGYCGEGNALETCFNFPKSKNPEPGGAMAILSDGVTMFVADSESHVIRKIDLAAGTIELYSGAPLQTGYVDGPAADARWHYPADFALDEDAGLLYVADSNNHVIRAIDLATDEVSTAVGTGQPSCELDEGLLVPEICEGQHTGGDGGPASEATLYRPFGVDLDLEGNLVIADTYNQRFRIVYR
ncbi:MAG: hypothetical protein KTR31_16765 [Myxococcales bacterium]|nr:hypothetical protein [Myxococcales bacterium]